MVRTRQLRIARERSVSAGEKLEARRRRRKSPDETVSPQQSDAQEIDVVDESAVVADEVPVESVVEDAPILGSQRESRSDRVMDDYPNMDVNQITEVMTRMRVEGNLTLIIHRFSEDKWRLVIGERVPRITNPLAFEGRLPRNFVKDVLHTKEFVKWSREWNDKTFEEKVAYAEEHDIVWDSDHPSDNIKKKNLGHAVRLYHRIEKWRPEYSGLGGYAARRQAKENAKIVT